MADERIRREAEFHDRVYAGGVESRAAAIKYYSVFAECRAAYLARLFDGVEESRVLEYGCGAGADAFRLAQEGASVVGIDVSAAAIEGARASVPPRADINFVRMNAESLEFDDRSFDLVCGTGILHHLDLEAAFSEIARVLKPGGRGVFVEPLGHNPIINAYRRFTPSMRSADEHPLRMGDFDVARRLFPSVKLRYFNLLSLAAVPLRSRGSFDRVAALLSRADRMLMRAIPYTRRHAWNVLIEVETAGWGEGSPAGLETQTTRGSPPARPGRPRRTW